MNRYFLPSLLAAPVAMVCAAEQVPATIDAQVALLKQVPSMSTAAAVDAILAMEAPQGGSPGYSESLKALKTVTLLTGCFIAEDEEQRAAYMSRCREDYPGLWVVMHMMMPQFAGDPEAQKQLAEYVIQLSPEQIKQDSRLLGLRCAALVSREGKQITPEKRRDIVLATLSGYPMDPGAQSILAVHYLYPEYKMQDAAAAQECILLGAQARCTPSQMNNSSDSIAYSLLESLAYAADQQKEVDTLALQFGAHVLAIQMDSKKPWAHYRLGMLWAEHANHPILSAFNPGEQAFYKFESAAREGHAPSLYALGKELGDPELMEQAVAMGYDSSKDYRHVSPKASVNYSICSKGASILPTAKERAFAAEANDAGFYLINRMAKYAEQHDGTKSQMLPIVELFNLLPAMKDLSFCESDADCLTATDEELLEVELNGFRNLLKLNEGNAYELYKLYRDGSDPTGQGKDAALAEQYLRRAALIDAHPEALRKLSEQEKQEDVDTLMNLLVGCDTKADELLVCFLKMADDPLQNIVPLDDALQAWAAKHPQQRKLAEALRIHYLLFIHNEGWKTSPENNAATREVRKRLLQIIRNVPEEVLDAASKEYLRQTFETQDAAEARDLRRWYAARKMTPPAN